MPAFGSRLSAAELDAIAAYLAARRGRQLTSRTHKFTNSQIHEFTNCEDPPYDSLNVRESPARRAPHRADAGSYDTGHLWSLGGSDPPQAASRALPSRPRPASARTLLRHWYRPHRFWRRRVRGTVPPWASRVRRGDRAGRGGAIADPADALHLGRTRQSRALREARTAAGRGGRHGRHPVLPRHSAVGLRHGNRAAGCGKAVRPHRSGGKLAANHHREAVRHGPRECPRAESDRSSSLRRGAGLPDRSLSREGNRPEPARVQVRERDVRAGLEPPVHRPRADHGSRNGWRRAPRLRTTKARECCATCCRTT